MKDTAKNAPLRKTLESPRDFAVIRDSYARIQSVSLLPGPAGVASLAAASSPPVFPPAAVDRLTE